MIIKIEDAPAVRHITIDIDFGEDGATTVVKQTNVDRNITQSHPESSEDDKKMFTGIPLDLDEDFTHDVGEVITKPEIDLGEREVKVSADMAGLEI